MISTEYLNGFGYWFSARLCVMCLYVHLDLVILFMRAKESRNKQQAHRMAHNMFARDKYQYFILIFHSLRIKQHKWPDALINAQYVVNIYVYWLDCAATSVERSNRFLSENIYSIFIADASKWTANCQHKQLMNFV